MKIKIRNFKTIAVYVTKLIKLNFNKKKIDVKK